MRDEWLASQQALKESQKKDYSIRKDPNTGEVIRGKDRDKNWTFWDKVGSTLLGALMGFEQGGIFGAMGGGIKAGMDRNYMEKLKWQMSELPKIQKQAKTAEANYKNALEFYGAENDISIKLNKELRDTNAALAESHKRFLETLLKDDVFDAKDSQQYFDLTGQKIEPFDNRPYETKENLGDYVERPNKGGGEWRPSQGLKPDTTKKPVGVEVKNSDGTTKVIPMLPEKAAEFTRKTQSEAAAAEEKSESEERKEIIETKKINFKSEADWRKRTNKARSTYNAAQPAIQKLNVSIAEVEAEITRKKGTFDITEEQKLLAKLRDDQAKIQREADEASAVMNAKKPTSFSLPERNRKKSRRPSARITNDPMGLYR